MTKLRSVASLAEEWAMSEQFVRDQINSGALKAERVGRQWIIYQEDVDAFLDARRAPC
jgi:excisionase family DNA binding protein